MREVLAALRVIQAQLMEIEKRLDTIETLSRRPMIGLSLLDDEDEEEESSEGYQSAP